MMKTYLLLRQVKIHNANALSSPLTIGFPAMTAWLGFMHALERKMRQQPELEDVRFKKLAVSCHDWDLQTYKGAGDYVNSIIITANPLRKKGASFERPPFIEEARIHLTVSLLIEMKSLSPSIYPVFCDKVQEVLPAMKIAGGDILSFRPIQFLKKTSDSSSAFSPYCSKLLFGDDEDTDADKEERRLIRNLMPGYVLVECRHLLQEEETGQSDTMQGMLDLLALHCDYDENKDSWQTTRRGKGWLIPIAVGFKGLTPLGHVANQRDAGTPHRFAEPILTLGEFLMPHHCQTVEEMMWQYRYEADKDLYVCVNEHEGED